MAPLLLHNAVLNFGHIFSPHSHSILVTPPGPQGANKSSPASSVLGEPGEFILGLLSQLHPQCPVVYLISFSRWCLFQSDTWKIIPVHVENMAKPSPSSLLPLIYNVVDGGAFSDVLFVNSCSKHLFSPLIHCHKCISKPSLKCKNILYIRELFLDASRYHVAN